MQATIQYKRPTGPSESFIKVAPSMALIQMVIKRYRALGWNYFVIFKDTQGIGVSAAHIDR